MTFLLEHLCALYETNPERSQRLFRGLVRRLVKMRAIDDLPMDTTTDIRDVCSNRNLHEKQLLQGNKSA